jgi:hypothetical protein
MVINVNPTKTNNITSFKITKKTKKIYFLIYHKHEQGSDYTNDILIYVYLSLDDMIYDVFTQMIIMMKDMIFVKM